MIRRAWLLAAPALAFPLLRPQETAPPSGPATVPSLEEPVTLDSTGDWLLVADGDLETTRARVLSGEDGVLRLSGEPTCYIATPRWYRDYSLEFEWRWSGDEPGNSGLLIHASTPLCFARSWPRCLEVQLKHENAGDFILMGDYVGLKADGAEEAMPWSVPGGGRIGRRAENLADGLEKPVGQWNSMKVVCSGDAIEVFVNGSVANRASGLTVQEGAIGLQSEGAPIEFRSVRLLPLD